MKIAVIFPSVTYREGPDAVRRLISAIENIGYHQLDMFDHVLMGYPSETRGPSRYPPKMPILEALMTLSHAAAVTSTIGLGTGVLVLPQRQITLVAKQVSTLDTLSGGRIRLGIGLGWQDSEFDALQENFHTRGRRMEEAVRLLKTCWRDEQIDFQGDYYRADAMAMEPKPPQGDRIPIWFGGAVPQTLRRVGELGDGWMGQFVKDGATATRLMDRIREHAQDTGRDPAQIGMQLSLAPWYGEPGQGFYADPQRMLERYVELRELGFDWTAIDTVPIFQAGHRSVAALIDYLTELFETLQPEIS
jgi:probable F420-dependent oxidoreductase